MLRKYFESEDEYKEFKKECFRSIRNFALFFLCFNLFLRYIFVIGGVVGHSMSPSYQNYDMIFVDRCFYRFSGLERGDVISFQLPDGKLIKRVVAIPGDTVEFDEGLLYINGEEMFNDGFEKMTYSYYKNEPVTLKDGEYFVLGDNRNHSMDSRCEQVGIVNQEQIVGKIVGKSSLGKYITPLFPYAREKSK